MDKLCGYLWICLTLIGSSVNTTDITARLCTYHDVNHHRHECHMDAVQCAEGHTIRIKRLFFIWKNVRCSKCHGCCENISDIPNVYWYNWFIKTCNNTQRCVISLDGYWVAKIEYTCICSSVNTTDITAILCTYNDVNHYRHECHIDSVQCAEGHTIRIKSLFFKWKYVRCSKCEGCCENISEIPNLYLYYWFINTCNNTQRCVIFLDGYWMAKIEYTCISEMTISTTPPTMITQTESSTKRTTSIITEEHTIPSATTTSKTKTTILTPSTAIATKSTTTTNGNLTLKSTDEDEFPVAATVSVPLAIIVIGVIALVVVCQWRKHRTRDETNNHSNAAPSVIQHDYQNYSEGYDTLGDRTDATYTQVTNANNIVSMSDHAYINCRNDLNIHPDYQNYSDGYVTLGDRTEVAYTQVTNANTMEAMSDHADTNCSTDRKIQPKD